MNLSFLKQKNAAELSYLKKSGKKIVGVFCTYAPKELIYASGALAISICAYDESPINEAHKELPRNLCPLVKASYGYALTKKCPYMNASDLIIGETTCDGKKKMFELMAKHKELHVMQLPNTKEPNSLKLWKDEILKLKERLEHKFNVKITDEKLLEAIEIYNKERDLMSEVMDLAKLDPTPISGSEMHDILFANDFIFDKNEKIKILSDLIDEYKNRAKSPFILKNNKKRILITGCPSGGVYDKIIKEIEKFNAVVVGFENCVGTKNFDNQVETKGDLYENLAKRYLQIPCSVIYNNSSRLEKLSTMIRELRVDGVVDITLSACHTYAIEGFSVKNSVKNEGASYLQIETDYSKQDIGQIRTRLEAFCELL